MSEHCVVQDCPLPVICHWSDAQGVTLFCEHHLLMLLTMGTSKPVEPERKPHKRGAYKRKI